MAFSIAAWFFFRKHRFTRILMPLLHGTTALVMLLLVATTMFVDGTADVVFGRVVLIFQTVRAGLWTGYFLRSKRVQQTFVN